MSRPLSRFNLFNLSQLMYWAGNAELLDSNLIIKCQSDPVLPETNKQTTTKKNNHNENVSKSTLKCLFKKSLS